MQDDHQKDKIDTNIYFDLRNELIQIKNENIVMKKKIEELDFYKYEVNSLYRELKHFSNEIKIYKKILNKYEEEFKRALSLLKKIK